MKTVKLNEAVKLGLRDMSDDDFNDLINSTLDLIDDVHDSGIKVIADTKAAKASAKQIVTDQQLKQELDVENSRDAAKELHAKKARERETNRYKNFRPLDDFAFDIYAAVKDQVEMIEQEYQSYDEINPDYVGLPAIMKADVVRELPNEAIPIINVYFDCSGSWDDSDIKLGERALASLKTFEDQGEIKLNILYFSEHVHRTKADARSEGSTSAWKEILDNIEATKANNVVIMTDSDMSWQAVNNRGITVPGYVWWLWKNGDSAENCVKKLVGEQGIAQYSFKSD